MLTNANLIANTMQMMIWLEAVFGKKSTDPMTYICALPLYHIFALTGNSLMGLASGPKCSDRQSARYSAFAKELAQQPFHVMIGLNTLFTALMNNEAFRKLDFSSLKLTFAGGMSVQRPVADRWRQITGWQDHRGLWPVETSPVATANCATSRISPARLVFQSRQRM